MNNHPNRKKQLGFPFKRLEGDMPFRTTAVIFNSLICNIVCYDDIFRQSKDVLISNLPVRGGSFPHQVFP
jgi:hypothetical protein